MSKFFYGKGTYRPKIWPEKHQLRRVWLKISRDINSEKKHREKDKRIEMRKSRFCKTGKRKNLTERLKKNEDLKEILTMI